MDLIDMNVLVTAAEAKASAEETPARIEEESVAYAINSAHRTGELRTVYHKEISEDLKSKLEGKGYKVTPRYRDSVQTLIDWSEAGE